MQQLYECLREEGLALTSKPTAGKAPVESDGWQSEAGGDTGESDGRGYDSDDDMAGEEARLHHKVRPTACNCRHARATWLRRDRPSQRAVLACA